jgi:hypothetical protein
MADTQEDWQPTQRTTRERQIRRRRESQAAAIAGTEDELLDHVISNLLMTSPGMLLYLC